MLLSASCLYGSFLIFGVFLSSVLAAVSNHHDGDYEEGVEADEQDDAPDAGSSSYGTLFVEDDRSESEALLRLLLIHNSIYDRHHRPTLNDTESVNVSMALSLHSLIDIDDLQGFVTINAVMGFKWYDWRLTWNPSTYSNLTTIPVKDDDIYHPEIVLLNGMEAKHEKIFAPHMAILHSNGEVLWYAQTTLKVKCFEDVHYWPFSAMYCDFKFGTPQYNEHQVTLYFHASHIDLHEYIDNHKWRLMKGKQLMMPEKNPDIRRVYGKQLPWIRLYFERRPNNFYLAFLSTPAVTLLLTIIFYVSANDPNTSYIVGLLELIFLCGLNIVLLRIMPPSPKLPAFALFIASGQLLVLGFLLSIPVLEFIQRKKRPPPAGLAAASRLLHRCDLNHTPKVMTFNEENDHRIDPKADWRNIASLMKHMIATVFVTVFAVTTAVSLVPMMASPADRWSTLESNINRSQLRTTFS